MSQSQSVMHAQMHIHIYWTAAALLYLLCKELRRDNKSKKIYSEMVILVIY